MPHARSPQQELIQAMLDALKAPVRPLTAWETNFVESVSDQFDRKGSLSARQIEVLDQIYTEKTA